MDIALTSFDNHSFVGKVMSLLLNMLSRFVIAFCPRSKCLNFLAAVTICSGGSGYPCLVPDLRGSAFSFLPLSLMLAVRLSYMGYSLLC